LKASAEVKTVTELKVALKKIQENNFLQNKAVLSSRNRLREHVKAGRRQFEHLPSLKISVHT